MKDRQHFLVIDFETNGIGKDPQNRFRPYVDSRMPLPRENYPVEVAAALLDPSGHILDLRRSLISGARRLDPWVLAHCPGLSIKQCDTGGVPMREVLQLLAGMIGDRACTLVAHNIQYDWDEVIVRCAIEQGLMHTEYYNKLASCKRFCTCVNATTLADRSAYFFARIGKWIGPKLSGLAAKYGVPYDETLAHDAEYDVRITVGCLKAMLQSGCALE